MPVILDTDLLSLVQGENQPAGERLKSRLRLQSEPACTTVINFEERVQGWFTVLRQASTDERILRAYRKLLLIVEDFRTITVLPFDAAAQQRFVELRRQKVRIGTLDLRIASIALANGAKLLSRNLRDFRKVPGLDIEDWTA